MRISSKKKLSVIYIFLAFIVVTITVTYSWVDLNQFGRNQAKGSVKFHDVTLVDEFVPIDNWEDTETSIPKRILVVNSEDADGDVYLRIKLKEYLEYGYKENEIGDAKVLLDHTGETVKVDAVDLAAAQAQMNALLNELNAKLVNDGIFDNRYSQFIDRQPIKVLSEETAVESFYMPIHSTDLISQSQKGRVNGKFLSDQRSRIGAVYDETSEPKLGSLIDIWSEYIIQELGTPYILRDFKDLNIRENISDYMEINFGGLDEENVISSAGWDGNPVDKWIIGDDGFFYWGNPLKPGEMTGDLISSIRLLKVPDDTFYRYYMDVQLDAISIGEIKDNSDNIFNGDAWWLANSDLWKTVAKSTSK